MPDPDERDAKIDRLLNVLREIVKTRHATQKGNVTVRADLMFWAAREAIREEAPDGK